MANFLGGLQKLGNFANDLSGAMADVQLNNLRIDDPAAYAQIMQEKSINDLRKQELDMRKQERSGQIEQQNRMRQVMQNPEILGQLSKRFGLPPEMISSLSSLDDLKALGNLSQGSESPSAVREYQYYNSLPEEQQAEYLKVKRTQQILDLGGMYQSLDPRTGQPLNVYEKTLAPGELPETKAAQEQAVSNVRLGAEPEIAAAKEEAVNKVKPMSESMVKMQDDILDKINTSTAIIAQTDKFTKQINEGSLDLNLMANLSNKAKNNVGMSTEESRNLASFEATLEKMRNDSLRLNNGVQTDGDAQRAWNELIANLNDEKVVKQRLAEIAEINKKGSVLQEERLNLMRKEFGKEPLSFKNAQKILRFNPETGKIE